MSGQTPEEFAKAAHDLARRADDLAKTNELLQEEIAHRRAVEQSLHATQAMLDMAQRAAQLALWSWNPLTSESWVSDTYWTQLGYQPSEINASQDEWFSMLHPDDRARVLENTRKFLENPDTPEARTHAEYRLRHKSGAYRWMLSVGNVLESDEQGRPIRLTGCLLDITERRELEDKIREREMELAHVSRLHALGEMVTGLAHELNQPLAAIATDAETCRAVLAQGDPARLASLDESLRRIAGAAHRAGEIVRRLRRMVRKEPSTRSPVNLAELLREAVDFATFQTRNESVAITVDVAEGLPEILADSVQIEQVALNLLQNAVEAVRQMPVGRRRIDVSAKNTPDGVAVEIRDSGHGIQLDDRTRIFEPFYSTKREGLGIGLAISRTIVESHGGLLSCECGDAGRTVFRFTLPCSESVADARVATGRRDAACRIGP